MQEWPSFVLLFRPPIFEHEAVDERNVVEEVENVRVELVLEGKFVPRAPTVAPPWVLSPNDAAVAAMAVVDALVVVVDVVDAVDSQDEEGVEADMASTLSSQLSPLSCSAV